jgi:Ca2+-binding RTX toxin-like protein
MLRRARVTGVVLGAVMAAAPAAHAAQVGVNQGGAGVFVSSLVNADADRITISRDSATAVRVSENGGAPLTGSEANCTGYGTSVVICTVTSVSAVVRTGAGNDRIVVANDVPSQLFGGSGNDEIQGGPAADTLDGEAGDDLLFGSGGNDTFDGGEGSDILYGSQNAGADVFQDTGSSGTDTLTYFFSDDPVTVTVADGLANDGALGEGDEVKGGFERLQGSRSAGDTLTGGPAAEIINGSGGDDVITGGAGADVLEGNVGNDTIDARDGGADTVIACDSPSDDPPNSGTNELAKLDAADPEPKGCERQERDGAPTSDAPPPPPPPPGGTTPDGVLNRDLRGCPTGGQLFLRPDAKAADLRAGRLRLLVGVPVGGWIVRARITDASGARILGAATSSAPPVAGVVALRPTVVAGIPDGVKVTVGVTVIDPVRGCVAAISDDLALDATPDGSSDVTPGARAAQAQSTQRVIDCKPPNPVPGSQDYKDLFAGNATCTPESPPQPPKCERLFPITQAVTISGACIKKDPKDPSKLTSQAKIDLNGIEITPQGAITWEGDKLKLTFGGNVTIAIPTLDRGRRTGEIVLYEGKGFSTSLAADEITLLDGQTSGKAKVGGFPVVGKASFKFTAGGGTLDLRFGLPKGFGPKGLQGGALLKLTPNGIELTDAVLKLPETVEIGRFKLKKLGALSGELRYKARDGKATWTGKLNAALPAPPVGDPPALDMEIEFVDGALTKGSLQASNINKPFGHPAVFLQSIGAGFETSPLKISGNLGVTFGPKLGRLRLASAELSSLSYTFSDPGVWEGSGKLKALGGGEATGRVKYSTDGKLDFDGALKLNYLVAAIEGQWAGNVVLGGGFRASGKASLRLPLLPVVQAGVNATDKALSVCGELEDVELGLTIRYSAPLAPELLQGCGLGEWGKAPKASAAARARAAATVAASTELPAGLPKAAFSATGTTGVPNVVLVGPGGRRINAPSAGGGAVGIASPGDRSVYFVVKAPAAGTWSLEVQDGSVPVASTRVARGIEEPKLDVELEGSGDRRVIRYALDGPPGTRVTFFEEGAGVGQDLGTHGGKGRVGFAPADGDPGRRSILAVLELDGLPLGSPRRVAGFRVGPAPKPGEPPCYSDTVRNPFKRESRITIGGVEPECARLKITLRGDDVGIDWKSAKNASGYRVTAKSSGRIQVVETDANVTKATVKGIGPDDGVAISVVAVGEDGEAGPAAKAVVRPARIRPIRARPLPDVSVLGLAEITVG